MNPNPPLYKKSSNGQIRAWYISVEISNTVAGAWDIVTTYGVVGGKMVKNSVCIAKGKNIGKSNETTPYEQAVCEAVSKWKKQKDRGYTPRKSDLDTPVLLPMLAHSYTKRSHDIKFPCVVQRKFDGIRCLATQGDNSGVITLLSRKGKPFPYMTDIRDAVSRIMSAYPKRIVLDGELYSDELSFQELTGLVRRQTLSPADEEKMKKIFFKVYDVIELDYPNTGFMDRYSDLFTVTSGKQNFVFTTETKWVNSDEHIKELHDQFVSEGYEGIIIRNADSKYSLNKRSKDLQKYKNFQDDEFEVVGCTCGTGSEQGCVIWICRTSKGQVFHVRPRGTHSHRKVLYKNGEQYVGKQLTVRYQDYTYAGVPRFPVGIGFRDYE